ncbi:MAG TPA: zf-HC2 domain-containing protein [Candidatus Acidoferrum sp.]|nr:zf-HC2 domain-containing protein [Candidatus Acidoferrum sp.]
MTAEECRIWRERIGALVLGQLDAAERAATEAHLEGCPACRAEAEALAPVAVLLSRADPDQIAHAPAPPADLGDRIARLIAAQSRAGRRRRVRLGLGLGAAAAAATASALIGVALLGSSSESTPAETVAFETLPPGASAQASLTSRPWGSDVRLHVRGFRPGTLCQVWLRRADGKRVPAGSFRYVYAGESDEADLSSAISPEDATAIGLRAGSRTFVAPL